MADTMPLAQEDAPLHSPSMGWLTTEHEIEMQDFVHQHLLSMLSPFSLNLKDLKDEVDALKAEMKNKYEQLKHTNTLVKQHGHELMTLTLDVNQAHTEVANLRKELLPEIEKKIDATVVDLEFVKVYEELTLARSKVEAEKSAFAKLEAEVLDLAAFARSTAANLAEQVGEVAGLRESSNFLNQCYSGMSGRVEQAKRIADDTHEAFKKFQHSSSNQLDDLRKSGLPRLASRLESLEARQQRMSKEASADVEDLQQVKLVMESVKEALTNMDETIQLQEKDKLTKADTTSSQSLLEEAAQRKSKMEQLHVKLNQTKAELTDLANGLHADLSRRVADLSTLLDAKTTSIRNNTTAIRTLETGMASTNSELRRMTSKVSEQGIVQDRLVEQARVAETEIHGLFEFRKETIPKLQEHEAGIARFELKTASLDRDIQNHTKHLTEMNSEVANVQNDVVNFMERLEVAHDLLRGVGRGLHDVHKQVDTAQGRIHGEKPSVLPNLPSAMQGRPSTAPLRRRE